MCDYKVEDTRSAIDYDDEVLCAGWNPCLALQPQAHAEENRHTAITIDLAAVDAEVFLKRMYAYQR
jgi:hypothetical protein